MADDQLRLRRGFLLLTLHGNYPHYMTRVAMNRAVGPFYPTSTPRGAIDTSELERDIAYLQEKGYLAIEESKVGAYFVCAYRLTTAGVDLVDGVSADPGILVAAG